nr:immunoglobulin heavy chain junction region [Mus musculus]NSM04269.1 immunoglobulin heavy chain junction region [Mus musculus]NSM06197.1 immunoglobulin heavy chain junction region [Mus musculus]NSM07033.1 immunoglobulin heavy chain junction region [Mus musculus]NSM07078.1 immunoglobulin heavy chain junction region [Mus musculus]
CARGRATVVATDWYFDVW